MAPYLGLQRLTRANGALFVPPRPLPAPAALYVVCFSFKRLFFQMAARGRHLRIMGPRGALCELPAEKGFVIAIVTIVTKRYRYRYRYFSLSISLFFR